MDNTPIKQVFEELYFLLEGLEATNIAILRFLKDEGVAPEEKLAPYLEQASNASSVKWRAARIRMERVFAPGPRRATDEVSTSEKAQSEPESQKAQSQKTEPQKPEPPKSELPKSEPTQAQGPTVSETESKASEAPSPPKTKHDDAKQGQTTPGQTCEGQTKHDSPDRNDNALKEQTHAKERNERTGNRKPNQPDRHEVT